MAWVADVLDDLLSLPVTPGTGGQAVCPGDALGRPRHPLESPAAVDIAISVLGGDTARQDTLNCASVEVCVGLRGQAKYLQPPEAEEAQLRLLHPPGCVNGPF